MSTARVVQLPLSPESQYRLTQKAELSQLNGMSEETSLSESYSHLPCIPQNASEIDMSWERRREVLESAFRNALYNKSP